MKIKFNKLKDEVQEQYLNFFYSKEEKTKILGKKNFENYYKHPIPDLRKKDLIDQISKNSTFTLPEDVDLNTDYFIGSPNSTDRSGNGNRFTDCLCLHNITIGLLSLAPSKTSGYQTCLHAGSCKEICVGHSGRTQMLARVKRTIQLYKKPQSFFERLIQEMIKFLDKNKDKNPIFRLNGYSDIEWETKAIKYTSDIEKLLNNRVNIKYTFLNNPKSAKLVLEVGKSYNIFQLFPDIWFYDYTKYKKRNLNEINNYHLTYSYDRDNDKKGKIKLSEIKSNISVIVDRCLKLKLLRDNPWKEKVVLIDGDEQDCRIIDDMTYPSELKKIILLEFQGNKEQIQSINDYAISDISDFDSLIISKI